MQNEVQFDKREWDSHKRGQYDYVTYSLMLMLFTLHYIHKTAIASFNVIELQQLSCTLNWVIEVMEKGKKKHEKYIQRMVGGWYLKSHQFCLLINIATFIRYEGVPYFYTENVFLCMLYGKKEGWSQGKAAAKKKRNWICARVC